MVVMAESRTKLQERLVIESWQMCLEKRGLKENAQTTEVMLVARRNAVQLELRNVNGVDIKQ